MKSHIDKEMAITRLDIQDYKDFMQTTCDDFNARIDQNKKDIEDHAEKIGKINTEIKQMRAFEENLQH